MESMKEKILVKSIKLFKEKGFKNVSVIDICNEFGVTKGSFYHHYKSKNDLLLNYYRVSLKDTLKLMSDIVKIESPYEQVWKTIEYAIDITLELGADLLKNLIMIDIEQGNNLMNPYVTEFNNSKEYNDLIISLIEKGQKYGEIRNTVDAKDLYFSYIAGLLGIAVNWSASGGLYDEKAELRKLFEIVFKV
ncbi:TetR/AcrR family transcriptional regulator [Anaerorhabdus sp.]|uniref:TetR/AcrR family transcriptional regulator n=1 Tax=Anaerorhabdus sp. TaxID=1872524 RepID=UPI002B219FC8|nr:TetR/AcrR family transcriptional regulator [Anaerorhabdus sp.]MEA4875974.1 TetR/AcrR family transcriptional regulator [Anaerorhabdus sp.]